MSNQIEEKFLSNFDIKKKYVVALSGGVDSAVLAYLANKFCKNVRTVFVNHNQEHSNDLEAQAKSIANKIGLDFISIPTSLKPNSSETQMRNVRIKELNMNIKDEEYLLFGHTLSDKVETFLLNIFRGTHLQGLKSTPLKVNKIMRPLLTVSKQEVIAYAERNSIDYLNDESNLDNQINRNWIRNIIVDGVKDRFAGSLEQKIDQIINEVEYVLPHETKYLKFIKSSKGYVEIPTGNQAAFHDDWYCVLSSSLLIFINKNLWCEQTASNQISYGYLNLSNVEGVNSFNNWNLAIPSKDHNISIRTLIDGDKIKTNGSNQKVTEVMRSFGIRGLMKEVWPLVILDEEIIWLPGIRKSDIALDFQKNDYSHIISSSIEKRSIENF